MAARPLLTHAKPTHPIYTSAAYGCVSGKWGMAHLADMWKVRNAAEHVAGWKRDPWQGYWKKRQSLEAAMKRLGYTSRHKK